MPTIKIYTHEVVVHSQILSLERVLDRPVAFDISLNVKGKKSSIQFEASTEEISNIKSFLGYTVYELNGDQWEVSPF